MRQISLRQEAGRLGGIGICGRELCCSTWIHDFKSVNTSAARYQNLSLNPTKLSGQCGRLKCCLNYELDTYMAALSDIPEVEKPLQTGIGPAKLQKTDIFRKLMWFSYNNENNWHSISCERVSEILELNAKGIVPTDLHRNETTEMDEKISKSNLELEMLDKKFSKNKKSKKKKGKPQVGNERASDQPKPIQENRGPKRPQENQQRNQNMPAPKPGSPRPEKQETKAPFNAKRENVQDNSGQPRKKKNKKRFNPNNRGNQNSGDQNKAD